MMSRLALTAVVLFSLSTWALEAAQPIGLEVDDPDIEMPSHEDRTVPLSELADWISGDRPYEIKFQGKEVTVSYTEGDRVSKAVTKNLNALVTTLQTYMPEYIFYSEDRINYENATYSVSQKFGTVTSLSGQAIRIYDILKDFSTYLAELGTSDEDAEGGRKFVSIYGKSREILSLVGRFVTVGDLEEGYAEGAAHGWVGNDVYAYDLSKNGARANVLDFVSENDLVAAVINDSFINKSLREQDRADLIPELKKAKSLSEISDLISGVDCLWSFPKDMSSRFSIYDYNVATNKLSIRLILPYGCEAARGMTTQMGLLLTPNEDYKTSFALLKQGKLRGFYGKDRKQAFKNLE